MNKYIIRTKIGTEKCIVADNLNIDIIGNKVTFWFNYSYTEFNDEYCNYTIKRAITELSLNSIEAIYVIGYKKCAIGELEPIYDARKECENER